MNFSTASSIPDLNLYSIILYIFVGLLEQIVSSVAIVKTMFYVTVGLGGLGVWTVLIIGIVKYSGERIANKLEIKWKAEEKEKLERMVIKLTAEENSKLEKLRSEINREQSTFISILESYSSVYQASQERRIVAIEILWENLLTQRDLIRYVETIYDTFFKTPELSSKKLGKDHRLEPVSLNNVEIIFNSVLKCRPFLGEYLWSLYNSAYIFTYRIMYNYNEDLKKGVMVHWHNDEYLMEILSKIFTSRESIPSSIRETRELLEQKILNEMLKITSGDSIAERNLSKARVILEAINNKP